MSVPERQAIVSGPEERPVSAAAAPADSPTLTAGSTKETPEESPPTTAAADTAGEDADGTAAGATAASSDEPEEKPRATSGSAKAHAATRAAEGKRMLAEAEQLLRAQRFADARDVFTRLTGSKSTRGRALVALAEIAFQEKNYQETIRSAKLAAERGGGARARVLLGDAHFRLSHFQDAATAYAQALRIDPENPSAKSGLALASKRM
jgi:tetratricopeptide (TPR) repeat protein